MRYPHVIFDFDGTLADSFAEGVAIFQRIGPSLGLKEVDPALAKTLPTRQFMKALGVSLWRLPKVVRAFQEAAAETAHNLHLFEGIADILSRLHADGVSLGILSSNLEETIRICLRANGVEQLFAFVIGSPKLFGKARVLRRICRQRQIDRDQLLYVGDESRDVVAAIKAKVAIAAVSWGFQGEALLRDSGATIVLQSPAELIDIVRGELR